MVWFCEKCKENNMPPRCPGYMSLIDEYDKDICPQCGNILASVNVISSTHNLPHNYVMLLCQYIIIIAEDKT